MPGAYFIRRRGTDAVLGPFRSADIKSMASSGAISPDDEVSNSADGPWRAARKIGGIRFPEAAEGSAALVGLPTLSDADLVDDPESAALPVPAASGPIDVAVERAVTLGPATSTVAPLASAAGTSPGVVVVRKEGISPSEAVQFAIDRFRANPFFYMLSSLLVALAVNLPGAGFWFIAAPILIGFYQCVRDEVTTGTRASFTQVFRGFKQFFPALVIGFWGSLLVVLGLFCCCVPGLVLLPVPFLAFIVAGRERAGGLKALTRALRVVEKDPLGLLASCILLYLIGLSGLLIFYVGVMVTLPIMLLGLYRVADQMLASEDA